MNISEIHEFIRLIFKKERGGFNTSAQIDQALHRASLSTFSKYKPIYSLSVEAKEALSPFRGKYPFTTNSAGEIAIPSNQNMVHLLSMMVSVSDSNAATYGFNQTRKWKVSFPTEDEIPDRLNSQNRRPTSTQPIADIFGINSYKLYPEQVHTGEIMFLKQPVAPVFAYTQTGRSIVYNSAGSTQLEWQEPYLNDVIFSAIRYLGLNLGDDKLVQYATELVKTQP
jgi:hypothetical protein